MNITLIRNDRLFAMVLPDEISGKHWVCDTDTRGMTRQLASIDAVAGAWAITPQGQVNLISPEGNTVASASLRPNKGLYHLKVPGESFCALLPEVFNQGDKIFTKLGLPHDMDIPIGRAQDNILVLSGQFVSSHHALLRYRDGAFYIVDLGSSNGVFVNGQAIPKGKKIPLKIGSIVFIMGLKIMAGGNFIALNNPGGRLALSNPGVFIPYVPQQEPPQNDRRFYGGDDGEFFRSPRIKRDVEERVFAIEDPPAPMAKEETPLILRIGPSIGMALASSFMGLYMVMNIASGEGSMLRMIPMVAMMVAMITGAILWPSLSARHTKKKNAEKEQQRVQAYAGYLDRVRQDIHNEMTLQQGILAENRITVRECFNRAAKRDRHLFERTPVQRDFLSLRIGVGDTPLIAQFKWPQQKLSDQDDILRGEVLRLAREPQTLRNAPLALSLLDNYVSGIVGHRQAAYPFIRGLLVQLLTLHAPNEVKIVVFCKEEERREWDFLFALPHIFDDSSATRYLATNFDEATELSLRLERELQQRMEGRVEVIGDYGAYYVVLALDAELAKRSELVARLSALRENKGFAVLAFSNDIRSLPRECSRIVELETLQNREGVIYSQVYDPNDHSGARQVFLPDIAVGVGDAQNYAAALARVAVKGVVAQSQLVRQLGFLEMFEVGRVEHLNIQARWKDNNPCVSMAAPVGVDAAGEPFSINVHEDYHGPHGLIAGMTGSGKSEFIITWILSLAVNYRPDEVSFVLIDYKGGGLAGAFSSAKNRLPHLAGTITNLDGSAIRRSLVSINSELKRRQNDFNLARERAGLGTMDIYRYQELYRSGMVDKPIPHLLIVSDEFAELKDQQPEFMDELVKTARIGRSLGVHLILATQKPSGVVNEQIWSNARFKVCLKVADAGDSREMLKVTDAAELVDPGRFYLLVGYNEFFALAQSAYAGTRYNPADHFEKNEDNSLTLITNTGRAMLSVSPQKQHLEHQSKTPESLVVLEHLVEVAETEQLYAPALWLDPIPEFVTLAYLKDKYCNDLDHRSLRTDDSGTKNDLYSADGERVTLNPLIGELDDPWTQSQEPLEMPLSHGGNAIVYGSTGSGKSTLLITMLASLLEKHSACSLNVYIIDFGAETLGAFRGAPQVGDVLYASDEEKMEMLFKMLLAQIQLRRKHMAGFDGGFLSYAQQTKTPTILVIINVFEVFVELFDRHIDDLMALTRDGLRYGVQFVLTTSRANGVPYRLLPNFKLSYALQLNSRDDYLSILGSLQDTEPPKSYARGLVKRDRLYEFQIAHLGEQGQELACAKELVRQQVGKAHSGDPDARVAPAVPSLPDTVTVRHVLEEAGEDGALSRKTGLQGHAGSHNLPFGIAKEGLGIVTHDFARSPVMMVLGEDEQLQVRFLRGCIRVMHERGYGKGQSESVLILDPEKLLNSRPDCPGLAYRCDPPQINAALNELMDTAAAAPLLVLVSLRSILALLNEETKKAFESYIQAGKVRNLIGLIFSGEPSRFSQFSYEAWFRELSSYGNGVWLGEGVNSQTTLKMSGIIPSNMASLPKDFGWYINRGVPALVKHVVAEEDADDD